MTRTLIPIKTRLSELPLLVLTVDTAMQTARSTSLVAMEDWVINAFLSMTFTASIYRLRSGRSTSLLLDKRLFQKVVAETASSLVTINFTHSVVGMQRPSITMWSSTTSPQKNGLTLTFWFQPLDGTIVLSSLKRFLHGSISSLEASQQTLLKDKLVHSARSSIALHA